MYRHSAKLEEAAAALEDVKTRLIFKLGKKKKKKNQPTKKQGFYTASRTVAKDQK